VTRILLSLVTFVAIAVAWAWLPSEVLECAQNGGRWCSH
jgi:hypothetical protein